MTSISTPGSFKGYSFKVWFSKNKDSIKSLLMGILALTTYVSTQNIPIWLQIGLTAIVPIVVKLLIDAIDFFSTSVEI